MTAHQHPLRLYVQTNGVLSIVKCVYAKIMDSKEEEMFINIIFIVLSQTNLYSKSLPYLLYLPNVSSSKISYYTSTLNTKVLLSD